MYFYAVRGKGSERSMARSNAAAKPLSALLILALLLLNFSVVSLRVSVPVSSAHPDGQDAAHTSAKDAATVAKQAGVGRLVLIHHTQNGAARALAAARAVFPNTELAKEGVTLEIPAARRP